MSKNSGLKCVVCGRKATHSVTSELRGKPGIPIKTIILHLVCDKHAKETNIDYWIDTRYWLRIVNDFNKKGILILKQFSNINIVKLDK